MAMRPRRPRVVPVDNGLRKQTPMAIDRELVSGAAGLDRLLS
jgi:hypothetical protein